MEKSLVRLRELLQDVGGDGDLPWYDKGTCSGMIYGYAVDGVEEEKKHPVDTVKEAMKDVCDGGLQCDQCKVYDRFQLFVTDTVVVEVPRRGVPNGSLMLVNLDEAQLTAMSNGLEMFVSTMWDNMKDLGDQYSEQDKVELYKEIRVAEQIREVINEYFK